MTGRLRHTLLIALLALSAATSALAEGQATVKMEVTAIVTPNCRMTLTPLNFGSYDPLGANGSQELDATAAVTLTCTRDSVATIAIDQGQNPASSLSRHLISGDQRLGYELYRDAARTQTWSTGTNALRYVSTGGITTSSELMVYGRIPPGQEVAAGSYNDVVTATVNF
jgi:spore coat protein U-like protein